MLKAITAAKRKNDAADAEKIAVLQIPQRQGSSGPLTLFSALKRKIQKIALDASNPYNAHCALKKCAITP